MPTPEDVPLVVPDVINARYSYGGSKIASELIAINYGRTGFDRVVVFRPHNVYGPDMGFEHVIPELVLRPRRPSPPAPKAGPVPFPIKGDGLQTRAFIHVDDFTEGLVTVIDKGEHLDIYHIGNPAGADDRRSRPRHLRRVRARAGVRARGGFAGETRRRCPDIDPHQAPGLSPRISLAEGLPGVVAWYRSNRHLKPAA